MKDGTWAMKLAEGMEEVQKEQETQRLCMEELMQQLGHLTLGLQALVQTLDQNQGEQPTHGQHNNHEVGGFQMRSVQLEFPRFDGEDPTNWLYRANQFFAFNQTTPQHKIFMASFHMEGKALIWFREVVKSRATTSWEGVE